MVSSRSMATLFVAALLLAACLSFEVSASQPVQLQPRRLLGDSSRREGRSSVADSTSLSSMLLMLLPAALRKSVAAWGEPTSSGCACTVCVRLTLYAAPSVDLRDPLLNRFTPSTCSRMQGLVTGDLMEAAASLGISVPLSFSPGACTASPSPRTAGPVLVSALSVCGQVQGGAAASQALHMHLQDTAAVYYAAALGSNYATCPRSMSGLTVAVDLVKDPGSDDECVTPVHELSCMPGASSGRVR